MSDLLAKNAQELDPRDVIDADSYRQAQNRAWYRKMWLTAKNPHATSWLEKNDKDWLDKQKKRLGI